MFRSTLTVSLLAALGTVISFLNQLVLARFFGTTSAMDAYLIAISLPLTISGLLAGIFNYQLVPALKYAEANSGSSDPLTSSLAVGVGLATSAVGVIAALASDHLIHALNANLPEGEYDLAGRLAHLTWLCLPLAALGTIYTAALHTRKRFFAATILTAAPMGFSLVLCELGHARYGITSAVLGQLLGYLALAAGLRLTLGKMACGFDWKNLLRIIREMPLAVAAVLVFVIFPFSDAFWGSRLGVSAVSYLGFAQRILVGLSGLAVVGATTVLFPRLAHLAASGESHELRRDLGLSMRIMLVCMAPLATIFGVMAAPAVQVLLQRGAFRFSDAMALSILLRPMLLGMVAMSCTGLLFKGLFARKEVAVAAVLSLIGSVVYFTLSGVLGHWMGLQGVGYAYAVAWWVILLAGAGHLWRIPLGSLLKCDMAAFFLRLMALSLLVGAVCYAGMLIFQIQTIVSRGSQFIALAGTTAAALAAYVLAGNTLVEIPEIQFLTARASNARRSR